MQKPHFTKALLLLGALALIVLGIVLTAILLPKPQPTSQLQPRPTASPNFTTITMTFDGEKLIAPTSDITVGRGTNLVFQVNSTNLPEELNIIIPGYNQKSTFSQNSVGNLEFTADRAGTFDIQFKSEDERTAETALYLVVTP